MTSPIMSMIVKIFFSWNSEFKAGNFLKTRFSINFLFCFKGIWCFHINESSELITGQPNLHDISYYSGITFHCFHTDRHIGNDILSLRGLSQNFWIWHWGKQSTSAKSIFPFFMLCVLCFVIFKHKKKKRENSKRRKMTFCVDIYLFSKKIDILRGFIFAIERIFRDKNIGTIKKREQWWYEKLLKNITSVENAQYKRLLTADFRKRKKYKNKTGFYKCWKVRVISIFATWRYWRHFRTEVYVFPV